MINLNLKQCAIYIVVVTLLGMFPSLAHAYTTLPSSSYTLDVGETKFLPVPDVYTGYVDKTVWTCSSPYISFEKRDEAGAIISIVAPFSGTALIELLFVEKYYDDKGFTRANTYYKTFEITCRGGGGNVDPGSEGDGVTRLDNVPKEIEMEVGDQQTITPKPVGGKPSGYSFHWIEWEPAQFVSCHHNYNEGNISLTALMPGKGVLEISTREGISTRCNVTVKELDGPEAPLETGLSREEVISQLRNLIEINHKILRENEK